VKDEERKDGDGCSSCAGVEEGRDREPWKESACRTNRTSGVWKGCLVSRMLRGSIARTYTVSRLFFAGINLLFTGYVESKGGLSLRK
jgi:hypothetical protein